MIKVLFSKLTIWLIMPLILSFLPIFWVINGRSRAINTLLFVVWAYTGVKILEKTWVCNKLLNQVSSTKPKEVIIPFKKLNEKDMSLVNSQAMHITIIKEDDSFDYEEERSTESIKYDIDLYHHDMGEGHRVTLRRGNSFIFNKIVSKPVFSKLLIILEWWIRNPEVGIWSKVSWINGSFFAHCYDVEEIVSMLESGIDFAIVDMIKHETVTVCGKKEDLIFSILESSIALTSSILLLMKEPTEGLIMTVISGGLLFLKVLVEIFDFVKDKFLIKYVKHALINYNPFINKERKFMSMNLEESGCCNQSVLGISKFHISEFTSFNDFEEDEEDYFHPLNDPQLVDTSMSYSINKLFIDINRDLDSIIYTYGFTNNKDLPVKKLFYIFDEDKLARSKRLLQYWSECPNSGVVKQIGNSVHCYSIKEMLDKVHYQNGIPKKFRMNNEKYIYVSGEDKVILNALEYDSYIKILKSKGEITAKFVLYHSHFFLKSFSPSLYIYIADKGKPPHSNKNLGNSQWKRLCSDVKYALEFFGMKSNKFCINKSPTEACLKAIESLEYCMQTSVHCLTDEEVFYPGDKITKVKKTDNTEVIEVKKEKELEILYDKSFEEFNVMSLIESFQRCLKRNIITNCFDFRKIRKLQGKSKAKVAGLESLKKEMEETMKFGPYYFKASLLLLKAKENLFNRIYNDNLKEDLESGEFEKLSLQNDFDIKKKYVKNDVIEFKNPVIRFKSSEKPESKEKVKSEKVRKKSDFIIETKGVKEVKTLDVNEISDIITKRMMNYSKLKNSKQLINLGKLEKILSSRKGKKKAKEIMKKRKMKKIREFSRTIIRLMVFEKFEKCHTGVNNEHYKGRISNCIKRSDLNFVRKGTKGDKNFNEIFNLVYEGGDDDNNEVKEIKEPEWFESFKQLHSVLINNLKIALNCDSLIRIFKGKTKIFF